MKFGKSEAHVTFGDDGFMTETVQETGLLGMLTERLSIVDSDISPEDVEVLGRFAQVEGDKLDSAIVEKSGEKSQKLKQILKNMTIGAILLAKVMSGAEAQANKKPSDLDMKNSTGTIEYATDNLTKNKLQGQFTQQETQQLEYDYKLPRNYKEPFNILNEQEHNELKAQQKHVENDIFASDLKKFYDASRKPSKEFQDSIRQLVFKYGGVDNIVHILKNSYLGLNEDGNEREIQNNDDFMKSLGLMRSFGKGKFLRKEMYNLNSNLDDDGKIFDNFIDKLRELKYSKRFDALVLAPEEMQFLLDNLDELKAFIKFEHTASAIDFTKLKEKFGPDSRLQPVWKVLPSEKLRALNE